MTFLLCCKYGQSWKQVITTSTTTTTITTTTILPTTIQSISTTIVFTDPLNPLVHLFRQLPTLCILPKTHFRICSCCSSRRWAWHNTGCPRSGHTDCRSSLAKITHWKITHRHALMTRTNDTFKLSDPSTLGQKITPALILDSPLDTCKRHHAADSHRIKLPYNTRYF